MNQTIRGYVLLIVLVYLQLMSGLMMAMLAQSGIAIQNVHDELIMEQRLSSALFVLHNLEGSIDSRAACQYTVQGADVLAGRSDRWWRSEGCRLRLDKNEYDFIWEKLADDVCGRVSMRMESEVYTAQYLRLTLHMPANAKQGAILVQSTLIRPVHSAGECHDQWHNVRAGYQSMRYLIQKGI